MDGEIRVQSLPQVLAACVGRQLRVPAERSRSPRQRNRAGRSGRLLAVHGRVGVLAPGLSRVGDPLSR